MKKENVLKFQEKLQQLQRQVLQQAYQVYQLSVTGQEYDKVVENMITTEAQIQTLLWVLDEDKEEVKPVPKPVNKKEETETHEL